MTNPFKVLDSLYAQAIEGVPKCLVSKTSVDAQNKRHFIVHVTLLPFQMLLLPLTWTGYIESNSPISLSNNETTRLDLFLK